MAGQFPNPHEYVPQQQYQPQGQYAQGAGYPNPTGQYPPQGAGYPNPTGQYPPQGPGYPHPAGQYPQGAGHSQLPPQGPPAAAQPSAPDIQLDPVAGYEGTVGFTPVVSLPPPPAYDLDTKERPREEFDQSVFIKEEDAKEALIQFTSEHCCYGSKPAKDIHIVELRPSSAYHYVLESFTEERETGWHQEPYTGQPVDGPMNGPAPTPWSITVCPPPMFTNSVHYVEVPHTASVKPCPSCMGSGTKLCRDCNGDGRIRCTHCHGDGHVHHADGSRQQCPFCHGHGRKPCNKCHGNGRIKCQTCNGCCQTKVYIRLTVTWKVHKGEHVVEKTSLPDHLVTEVAGNTIFSQEFPRVWPVTTFFESDINHASQRLVANHAEKLKSTKLIMQRHKIRSVPVTETTGNWNDKTFSFWVYGHEMKVFCPDYPQKCCCGCVLL